MNLSEFREDLSLHTKGSPIPISDGTFFVRRWGTPKSIAVRRNIQMALFSPLHRLDEADEALIYAHWLVEYGVSGWENIAGVDGVRIDYSERSARKIFLNPEYMGAGGLNETLVHASMRYENYLFEEAQEAEEALKK